MITPRNRSLRSRFRGDPEKHDRQHGRRIVAVVVTFNRLDMLRRQLARLAEIPELDEVLVVDNASTDGTGEWLRTQPVHRRSSLTENTGGAGGFSHGLELGGRPRRRPGRG